jgi:hypothetical protein
MDWGQKNVYGKSVHFDICWHQNLLGNMDNAMVKYREVSCPGAITRHMDCTGDHKNEDNEEEDEVEEELVVVVVEEFELCDESTDPDEDEETEEAEHKEEELFERELVMDAERC